MLAFPMDSPPPLPSSYLLKVPQQERSIAMVHGILDAATVLLQDRGAARLTTNHLAEVGGVSVGSIYQYFENRDMIRAAIVERGVGHIEQRLRAAAQSLDHRPLPEAFGSVLDEVVQELEPYHRLLVELLNDMPVFSTDSLAATLEARMLALAHDVLAQYPERYSLQGGSPALYATVNGLIYVGLKWLSERPAYISREQLVTMCVEQLSQVFVERS